MLPITYFNRILVFFLPLLCPFLLIPISSSTFSYVVELKNVVLIIIFAGGFQFGLFTFQQLLTKEASSSTRLTYLRILILAICSIFIVMSLYTLKHNAPAELFWLLILYSITAPAYAKAIKNDHEITAFIWGIFSGMCLTIAVLVAVGFWVLYPALFLALSGNSAAYHLDLVNRTIRSGAENVTFLRRFALVASILLLPSGFAILAVSNFLHFYYLGALLVLPLIVRIVELLNLKEAERIKIDHRKLQRLSTICIMLTLLIVSAISYLLVH